MNLIKYINPKTGERKDIRVIQPSHETMIRWYNANFWKRPSRRATMSEADAAMAKMGFVRCGKRWGSRAAIRLAETPAQAGG